MNYIHFIWLGGELPKKALSNIQQWLNNPNWKVILWTNKKCDEIKSAKKGRLYSHTKFKGPEKEDAIQIEKNIGVYPLVYFMDNKPGADHCYLICFEEVFKKPFPKLTKAILCETEDGLKPVASDILRVLILNSFGGWYIDVGDVLPSEKPMLEIDELKSICGDVNTICHITSEFPNLLENDIIFSLKDNEKLSNCIQEMQKFYDSNDNQRIKFFENAFEKKLTKRVKLRDVENAITIFKKQLEADLEQYKKDKQENTDSSLYRYSKILIGGSTTGQEEIYKFYDKEINESCSTYYKALEDSVNTATFKCFVKQFDKEKMKYIWRDTAALFSESSNKKRHYSWKTPGLSIVETYNQLNAPQLLSSIVYTDDGISTIKYNDKEYDYEGDIDCKEDIIEKIIFIENEEIDDSEKQEAKNGLKSYEKEQ